MEDRDTVVLLITIRRGTKERNMKLQGSCADVGGRRSGTHRVSFFVLKKKENLKAGRSCTWKVSMASVASTFR